MNSEVFVPVHTKGQGTRVCHFFFEKLSNNFLIHIICGPRGEERGGRGKGRGRVLYSYEIYSSLSLSLSLLSLSVSLRNSGTSQTMNWETEQ